MMRKDDKHVIVPLLAEKLTVAKRRIMTGRVRVSTFTRERENLVEEFLVRERVEIERTPVGKALERVPAVREEGDTLIIPVVEEVPVIGRRLVLKEEIRIRRVREREKHQERVKVRKQDAIIERFPTQEPAATATAAGIEQQIAGKEK